MTQLAEAFDTDPDIKKLYDASKAMFAEFAAMGDGELPENPIDAMQIKLARWQNSRFGGPQSDERMALGVIEEVTESETATTFDESLDALGDSTVFGAQLLTTNRLAIRPILAWAQNLFETVLKHGHSDISVDGEKSAAILTGFVAQLMKSQGMLAQVVLKGAQKVRGLDDQEKYRKRLVGALGTCIARCAMPGGIHTNGEMNIGSVFVTVGNAVCQREVGHDAIPKLTVH